MILQIANYSFHMIRRLTKNNVCFLLSFMLYLHALITFIQIYIIYIMFMLPLTLNHIQPHKGTFIGFILFY